jgi:hypothetical protein
MGIAALSPIVAELAVPGVVFRRVEDPSSLLEYGIVWFESHASMFGQAFVDLARELTGREPAAPRELP